MSKYWLSVTIRNEMWEFSEEEGSQFLTSSISNTALPMFMECSADWMLNGGMPLPAMAIFLPYCSASMGGEGAVIDSDSLLPRFLCYRLYLITVTTEERINYYISLKYLILCENHTDSD